MPGSAVSTPYGTGRTLQRWLTIHDSFVLAGKNASPDFVFLGDCLFDTLSDLSAWHQFFACTNCLSFCIRDDRTEHLLWRLQNGELDSIVPRIVVLHIGKNNRASTAQEVMLGILYNVHEVRARLPYVDIVLPTMISTDKPCAEQREKDQLVNDFLRLELGKLSNIWVVDIARTRVILLNDRGVYKIADFFEVTKDFTSLHGRIFQLLHGQGNFGFSFQSSADDDDDDDEDA